MEINNNNETVCQQTQAAVQPQQEKAVWQKPTVESLEIGNTQAGSSGSSDGVGFTSIS
jgi:hypothetical protein